MNYLTWNEKIAEYFFNPEKANRRVYLYVTKDLIEEIGNPDGIDDFIKAIKSNDMGTRNGNICTNAKRTWEYWKYKEGGRGYPRYLAYLALFALTASKPEEKFDPISYYPDLYDLLGEKNITVGPYPGFQDMRELWDDLEQWSQTEKCGEWGLFYSQSIGGNVHIGYPLSQTLLTEPELKVLPAIFDKAQLDPTSPGSEEEIRLLIIQHGNRLLRKRTLTSLKSHSSSNNFRQELIARIIDELRNWDGTAEIISANGHQQILGHLVLCCQLDEVAENVRITLRCQTKHEFPEDDLLLHFENNPDGDFSCYEHDQNWSSIISDSNGKSFDASRVDWSQGLRMRSLDKQWSFKLPASPIRIFVTGSRLGLPGLVEVRQLTKGTPFYLGVHQSCREQIEQWGSSGCKDFKKVRITKGLPQNWHFYKVAEACNDDWVKDRYPILAFPNNIQLNFAGGIRLDKGNQFFDFAVPQVWLDGVDDTVQVYCQNRLLIRDRQTGLYTLPTELLSEDKTTVEAREEERVIRRISLSLIKNFTWKDVREQQQFDRFGQLQHPTKDSGNQGAIITATEDLPPWESHPSIKPQSSIRKTANIFWIGKESGQIKNSKYPPSDWSPVWTIYVGDKYHEAQFCGVNIATSQPIESQDPDPRDLVQWQKMLWRDRKQILLVERHSDIRSLWKQYQKTAKRLKIQAKAQETSRSSPVNNASGDRLLYVVSAKQKMAWGSSFKDVFSNLYQLTENLKQPGQLEAAEQQFKTTRWETVRALDALGHCNFEFGDNSSWVYVAPPALVRLPLPGIPQAILTGARSPQTIEEIYQICQSIGNHIKLEVTDQTSKLSLVPQRIAIQAREIMELKAIADSLGITFSETPLPWSLLHFSGSLDDYLATLEWSDAPELNWERETFDPAYCGFDPSPNSDRYVRLCKYKNPVRKIYTYHLWKEVKSTEIDQCWGRYAVLKALGLNVLVYDPQRWIVAVPMGATLPRLIERSLTLCSGYVAENIKNLKLDNLQTKKFKLFRDIPPQIAEMIAQKLSQQLSIQNLKV
ncbi:hypothetical protein [Limnospira fusiformis]|uniref:hypothetical protein n=1 Tax=Limnospira fusiformis TaxID=54297 RepID=UPI001449D724|nr:hypothetical protein HFV01_30560 [Limnospira fusiformis SAG 85.79]